MNLPKGRVLFPLIACAAAIVSAASLVTATELPRSTPEEQGVSSARILAFIEAADRDIDAMNSFMLLRHGKVVTEGWWSPYDAASPHELYSLSKSFTSTAVGFAVAEGRLRVDDLVLKFFPDNAPAEPSANLKAMRVRDLLTMSTGHQDEPPVAADRISTSGFLAQAVPHKPGTHFKYNTPATYMLSAIVEKVTGTNLVGYLTPRLFNPLGIENPSWPSSAEGITLGGYGLRIRTEDIARFGQFYLQKGNWAHKQLLPAEWIDEATSRQMSNGSNPDGDWDQGYGYQFWRCRHGAYRGDGAFGQYCIVLPRHDAVVAITSGVRDMQAVMNLVWNKLLPALEEQGSLPPNPAQHRLLQERLSKLALPPQTGSQSSPVARRISGKTFRFPTNDDKIESIRLDCDDTTGKVVMALKLAGRDEQRIDHGYENWTKGRFSIGLLNNEAVAGSGAWTSDDTYVAKLCACETPFYLTLTLRFTGEELALDTRYNVAFGPTQRPRLTGRMTSQ